MTMLDEFRRDERRVLDRLVDDELGLHERRELLAGLDDEPGAWRRCALAFLEAQSWRWQMSRMASEPILAQLSAAPQKSLAARPRIWGGFLAIAAGLILAFGVGTRFPTIDTSVETVATNGPSLPHKPESHTVTRADSEPAINKLAEAGDEVPERPWQTLTLMPVGGTGSEDSIELRVAEEGAEPWFAERPPLASSLARSLERDGWQVNRRQQLVPIALSDGRQLVVPVEEVDLRRPDEVQF